MVYLMVVCVCELYRLAMNTSGAAEAAPLRRSAALERRLQRRRLEARFRFRLAADAVVLCQHHASEVPRYVLSNANSELAAGAKKLRRDLEQIRAQLGRPLHLAASVAGPSAPPALVATAADLPAAPSAAESDKALEVIFECPETVSALPASATRPAATSWSSGATADATAASPPGPAASPAAASTTGPSTAYEECPPLPKCGRVGAQDAAAADLPIGFKCIWGDGTCSSNDWCSFFREPG